MSKRAGVTALHVLGGAALLAAVAGAAWMALRADRTGRQTKVNDYDLSPYRKVDPALVIYQEVLPPLATGMKHPTGIAFDAEGRLYLAGEKEFRVLDREGRLVRQTAAGGDVRCLAVGADGKVYAALRDHVEVFDAAGKPLAAWPAAGPKAYLTSIALHGDSVFVADYGQRCIRKYNRDGALLASFDGRPGAAAPANFSIPSPFFDLAIDPCEQLVVANTGAHRLETYSLDGQRKGEWGRFGTDIEGFCGCCNPCNFALLKDGSFVTAEKGITRVKLYGPDGTFKGVVAPPAAFEQHDSLCEGNLELADRSGLDVAVDAEDRVHVLDPVTAEVRIFVPKK